MIELRNVSKRYEGQTQPAVNNLSMKINKGEICVFVGPSGCGKSTTLRLMNRMIAPTSGGIYLNGTEVRSLCPDELRQGIGYVIQQIGLLPHKTVEENIAIVPRLHGWKKDKIKDRTRELVERIGLDVDCDLKKYPSQLSGGQMQRVGVARAMAVDPEIMLMDEPFGAVDPIARCKLQDEFLKLQKTLKMTICFVTHDIDEAIKMGDRIAIFNQGNIVQYDTPENILKWPVNDFVKDFIGSERLLKSLGLTRLRDMKDLKVFKKREKLRFVLSGEATIQDALSYMLENADEKLIVELKANTYASLSFRDIQQYLKGSEGGSYYEVG